MQKLSWKEKYAGILVLLIGIIFLLVEMASILSDTSKTFSTNQGALIINKNAFFSDVKAWIVIIMALAAGPLLLKNKTTGWVLGLPVLMFFAAVLVAASIEQIIKTGKFDVMQAIPFIGLFLLVMAILFLFSKQSRKNYRVSKYNVLLTLLLFVAVSSMFAFLQ